jgi:hypothetical protein
MVSAEENHLLRRVAGDAPMERIMRLLRPRAAE